MCAQTSAMIQGLEKGRIDRVDDPLLYDTQLETATKLV
jgi:hypothetical protein